MNVLRSAALLCALTMTACSHAASTPDALAKSLQSALDKGDFDAARKLAELDDAPAQLHFFFFDTVRECASEATCTVSAAPATDELRSGLKAEASRLHALAPAVEGTMAVAVKSRDGSGSGTMSMPYAKVGDAYKLVSIRYPAEALAALRAKGNDTLLAEFFAQGIRDSGNTEPRTDWATAATRLPTDGGEAGQAFVAQTQAMSRAVDAGDPDAAMHSGGQMATIVFRDKDFDGEPIPLADRKRKLHVQSLRMLRDVKVSGGYALGDNAVLLIDARDGIGWTVRGPILLSRDSGSWERAGDNLVSYPPAK